MSRHIETNPSAQPPDIARSLPGLAAEILRLIPVALLLGTLLIAMPSIVARLDLWPEIVGIKHIGVLDALALGLILAHWIFLLAAAIGAFTMAHMRSLTHRVEGPYPDAGNPAEESQPETR